MSPARLLVRTTGELLVSAGALILLFLVWQLFWTDVVAQRAQARTTDAVLEQWDTAQAEPGDDPVVQQPDQASSTAEAAPEAAPQEPATAPAPPVLAALPAEVLGVLRVPAFGSGYATPILEGTTDAVLREGIGRYTGAADPGGIGNFALAGHRTTYGAPLNQVLRLETGDPVVVETADSFFVYRVESTEIVLPEDVSVIAPVPGRPGQEPTEAYLTLTTCHPMYSARQRYIVHAVLDEVTPRTDGAPVLG